MPSLRIYSLCLDLQYNLGLQSEQKPQMYVMKINQSSKLTALQLVKRQQERREFMQREMDKTKKRPMNEQLARYPQVVLIDQDGKNVGVKPYREAMHLTRNAGLNLVEVVVRLRQQEFVAIGSSLPARGSPTM